MLALLNFSAGLYQIDFYEVKEYCDKAIPSKVQKERDEFVLL